MYSGCLDRSSRPEVFCIRGVLRNFTKFTGKHLCQTFLFNNVAGLRPATLLKKRLWRRCFPVNFVKFLRTPFFIEHLWWLLLFRNGTLAWKDTYRNMNFQKLSSFSWWWVSLYGTLKQSLECKHEQADQRVLGQ